MTSNIPANLTAPILAFDVTSGGQFENESRMILIGHGLSSGSLAGGSIAPCSSLKDARILAGAGSMLEGMFLIARRNAPMQEIWLANVADTGTAEARTITCSAPPAAGGQGFLQIAGRTIAVAIAEGSSAADVASALALAINGYRDRTTERALPYTATIDGHDQSVVWVICRHKGVFAAGYDFFVPLNAGNNILTGRLAFTTEAAGAGVPDISSVLAAMGDEPFETMISAFGDAGNLARVSRFLSNISGRWSYARQLYGHYFYPATGTSSDLTTAGLARDDWHLTLVPRLSGGGNAEPDYEFVAGLVARVAPWLGGGSNGDVSRNQTGLVVDGVTAPRDRGYWPEYKMRNAWLQSGVSAWKVSRSGEVTIDKLVTQQQTANGAPDTTFRDIQRPYQLMYALKKFRADLAAGHANKAISNDNPDNLDALTTVKDIKATLVHSYLEMSGVLENDADAIEAMVVARDPENLNRVNIHLPLDVVNPLDIFAGLAVANGQAAGGGNARSDVPLLGDGLRAGDILGDEPAGFAVDMSDGIYVIRGGADERIGSLLQYFSRASGATYWGADGLLKTAAAHEPRIEYDPITHEWLGLLGEGVSTNLLWHSEASDNPYWVKINGEVSADATIAPDGALGADKFVPSTNNISHYIQSPNMGLVKNATYTLSGFFKDAGYHFIRLILNALDGNICNITFNLETFAISAPSVSGNASFVDAVIEDVGGGWRRCALTAIPKTGDGALGFLSGFTAVNNSGAGVFAGDGVSGIYEWGAQLEAGRYASSYIKTGAAAGTRSADLITVPALGWLSPSEGTLYAEWRPISNNAPTSGIVALGDPLSNGNILNIARSVGGGLGFYAGIANVNQLSGSFFGGIASPAGAVKRGALAYRVDDYAWALAGVPGTDGSAGVPPVSELRIGRRDIGSTYANSHLRRVAYFPRRLSNAELVSLTS